MNSVITGMGCLSAAGLNLEKSWASMLAGSRQCQMPAQLQANIKRQSPVFEVQNVDFPAPSLLPHPKSGLTSCLSFLLTALEEALQQANLKLENLRGQRVGVCIGTTVGCTLNNEPFYRDFKTGIYPGLEAINRFLANNPACFISETLNLNGPVCTINNACTSGVDALGQAIEWLQDDLCDMVIAGGTDELSRIPYLGFSSLMNTSETPCKPFDLNRDGLNLGEGAGVLILENPQHTQARRGTALLEITGYGTCTDAYHPTAPHPQGLGLEKAIRSALGKIEPKDIAFINAHGTATPANDPVEGNTFARLFGPQITVFGTKGYTGHTLGAAGAIEAIFTAQGLLTQQIPATAGCETPDPACIITPTQKNTPLTATHALSTSLAFGGNNSALLLSLRMQS